jgi:hypothetical protein
MIFFWDPDPVLTFHIISDPKPDLTYEKFLLQNKLGATFSTIVGWVMSHEGLYIGRG